MFGMEIGVIPFVSPSILAIAPSGLVLTATSASLLEIFSSHMVSTDVVNSDSARLALTYVRMSGAILILASALGGNVMSSLPYAQSVLDALLVVFVPATIIVAVKNVFTLARN